MIANLPPYPAYKPSGVDWLRDIPAHWEVLNLRSILTSTTERNRPDLPLLSVVREKGVILRDVDNMDENHNFIPEDLTNYKVVHKDQFAMNKMKAWQGSYGVSEFEGIVSPAYFTFDIRGVTGDYFHRAIRSKVYVPFFAQASDGVRIGQWDLSRARMKEIPFALPPLPEQRAIARYLDHIDRRIQPYIEAKEKLIALLQEARQVATLEAMKSLNSTDKRLLAVTEIVERPIRRASDETYTPIGLYNRGRGIFRKEPRGGDELGNSDFFRVEEGDLVISGQFAWEGAIALASSVEHGCVASHRFPIFRGKPGIAETGFLLAAFQTDWGQLLLDHNSRGAAGRNRPLNVRTLLKEKISLPPIGAQQRVVEMLQLESRVRKQATVFRTLLNEYRASLIAHVVTGKLDVRAAAASLSPESPEQEPVDR